ncbi:hypothetical protein [Sphingomonas sp. MMS24-J13]|uniref:hypothetical protein n=1 Tax=Sphingomonas sp. MMS24-J13 TaxID=3238686 RepID=UPI00384BB4AD
MKIFEFIRNRLVDEEGRYTNDASSTIVGTALSRIIMHEALLEDRRQRNGQPPRSDQDLMIAALVYLDQHWSEEMSKAQELVEARSISLLEDRLKKALEFAHEESERQKHPVWFAVWTGVLANTAWLIMGATILALAILWTGHSLEDTVKKMLM